jgi:zinc-ribbon domain
VADGTNRCRVCDEPLAPGATFCPRCGTRVEDDAAHDEEAMTGQVVDDPTAAPGAYEATQTMSRPESTARVGVAGAPVDAGEPGGAAGPTPEEEEKSRRMRLLVAAIVVVIVLAVVVLVALAFTSGGGGGNPPSSSVPSTAVTTTTRPPVTTHDCAPHDEPADDEPADDEPAHDEPADDDVAAYVDLTEITVTPRR